MEEEGATVSCRFLGVVFKAELEIKGRIKHTLSQDKIHAPQTFYNMIQPTFPIIFAQPKNVTP